MTRHATVALASLIFVQVVASRASAQAEQPEQAVASVVADPAPEVAAPDVSVEEVTAQPLAVQPPPNAEPRLTYVEESQSVPALWIPGVVVLPLSWIATWAIATALIDPAWDTQDWEYYGYLWIPLVGPWLALGPADEASEFAGAIVGGVTQLAGLTLIILGLALRQTARVSVYAEDREGGATVALTAGPTPGGGALGLDLRF
jgi:hypothetical protein